LPNYPSPQTAKIELGKETCCLGVIIAHFFQKKYKNLTFRIFSRAFLPNYPPSPQTAKVELGKKNCCIGVIIAHFFQKKYKNLTFRTFFSLIFAKFEIILLLRKRRR
jgi:hypothetical protein